MHRWLTTCTYIWALTIIIIIIMMLCTTSLYDRGLTMYFVYSHITLISVPSFRVLIDIRLLFSCIIYIYTEDPERPDYKR